jgi:hypothetical protein
MLGVTKISTTVFAAVPVEGYALSENSQGLVGFPRVH